MTLPLRMVTFLRVVCPYVEDPFQSLTFCDISLDRGGLILDWLVMFCGGNTTVWFEVTEVSHQADVNTWLLALYITLFKICFLLQSQITLMDMPVFKAIQPEVGFFVCFFFFNCLHLWNFSTCGYVTM